MQAEEEMAAFALETLAQEQLEKAAESRAGRSVTTVYGGREQLLRQLLVALTAGATLSEHENPGDATLVVIRGRVRLHAGDRSRDGSPGELVVIPRERHSLEALDDAAVLLTIVPRS